MNFRSRQLLDLAYSFDCLLQIPGVCTGGTGEPCHANWPEHGKGMSMKAHDCYAVPGCRACHMALDQGSQLSGEQRKDIWLRAFWKYLPMLWLRGRFAVAAEKEPGFWHLPIAAPPDLKKPRRASRCTASTKQVPRPPSGCAR